MVINVDGLKHPQDLDCIRLKIKDNERATGGSHQVDIPPDLPQECFRYLPEMLLAPCRARASPGCGRALL